MVVKPDARVRVLSPHLDDAVLSCGGTLHRMARAGHRVEVVTVFAGDPPGPPPPFAQALYAVWGYGDAAMAGRRAEDRAALALLGAIPVHLDFPDVIYRRDARGQPLCAGREGLFRPPHPEEFVWISRLVEVLEALPWAAGDLLLAPLAIGGHVDHRLVREAVAAWRPPGVVVRFYEDFPYVEREAFAPPAGWRAHRVFLDEADLQARAQAVLAYRSQWPIFFAREEEVLERLRAAAQRAGEGIPAERFWEPEVLGAAMAQWGGR